MRDLSANRMEVVKAGRPIQGEVLRKMLHFLIAMVPPLATWNLPYTMLLLASGAILYTAAEMARASGTSVFLIGDITSIASRPRDRGRLVMGPVTLALGAMLALLLYPEPAASLAIYALAFGDGLASLVGMTVRGPRLPFAGGKTVSGSLACFLAVFLISLSLGGSPAAAAVLGLTAAFLESLPSGDLDNILIPIGVGSLASTLLPASL